MSRVKWLALFFTLVMALLWPLPAAAQNPDTCLPACYAYNKARAGGDGTENAPWYWDKANDPGVTTLRQLVGQAVSGTRTPGTLQVIDCNDAQPATCTATLYSYAENGDETVSDLGPVPVPKNGVPLPFPYVLGGGALLGVTLLTVGIVLRRRA